MEFKFTKWDHIVCTLLSAGAVADMIWTRHDPSIQKAGFFLTLLIFSALTIAYEFLRPKPEIENSQPLGLGDFQFPTATEGRPIPLLWGRCRVKAPNVVWYGDFAQQPIIEKVKTGIFSSEKITKGYRYRIGMQLAICRGPDVVLRKIYIGDDEVFTGTVSTVTTLDINDPELFGGDDLGTGGVQATCEFYPGSTSQAVSDYLARFQDAGAGSNRTPRYTGTSYLVARQLSSVAASAQGAYLGNSTSIAVWSFDVERYPAIFSGQSAGEHKIGTSDCNPINVLYEILTNEEWGLGFNVGDIDVGIGSTFLAAADLCITEGNGFSMVLDQTKSVDDVVKIIEKQIDGVLYLDQRSGLWKLEMARQDYDVDLVPQLNSGNISQVKEYTPGAWEDTSNIVRVKFDKRDDEYKSTYAIAQDMANAITVGGGTVSTSFPTPVEFVMPGVKNADNAAKLAWRELKSQSYPLSKATLVVNREMWTLHVGSVVAWTDSELGFTKVPFRVTSIDFGRLQQNEIELSLVQDVFGYQAAGFGSPPATEWTPPSDTLVAIPSAEQLAFEAPRGIQARDPDFTGDYSQVKIWCAGRRQGNEARILIRQRNASGVTSGSYADAGTINGFMRIGSLKSNLAAGTALPTGTITIEASPDSQVDLLEVFDSAITVSDLGAELSQLILVGNEFMLVASAAAGAGTDVDLTNVYRGVMDSVQENHTAGDDVYLIFVGGNITSTTFPNVRNVDIKLLPNSRSDTLAEASATTISLSTNKRNIRPTPPAEVSIDASRYDATPSLEGSGVGFDGFRNDFTWLRRDFRLQDEVESLETDAGTLAPDFPAENSTEYQLTLYGDPSGTNDLVFTSVWVDGSTAVQVTRTEILENMTGGVLPTEMKVVIQTRHDVGSETLTSRYNLEFTYQPTSSLTGQFAFGSLPPISASEDYTALSTGTYSVAIGTAFTTSNVQYRLNGGAWTTCIAATTTTGTIPGVTASDIIEIRHTAADGISTFFELQDPGASPVAFAVLHD